jgi:hypothetical protein
MSEVPMTIEELLAEQLRWLRAAAMPSVRQTIVDALSKPEQRRAFELCDGSRSGAEVASAVGVSPQSISNWSSAWRNLGIAYEVEERKVKHLISLAALGVDLELGGGSR